MIAYKTFAQAQESERPQGIPLAWPWQELPCENDQITQFEILGFTVVTDAQYASYKATHQAVFDAWNLANQDAVVYWKIYDFIPTGTFRKASEIPIDKDFRTSLTKVLHRKSILVKGECVKEEYYENCSVDAAGNLTFTNLIVHEQHSFARDSLGFPVVRNSFLHFYDRNNVQSGAVKHWAKYYSPLEKIQEGKTRRSNLVDNLQMPVIGLIAFALNGNFVPTNQVILTGRNFLFDYKKEFDSFVDESNKEILACLNDPEHPRYMSAGKYSWINSMTPYAVTVRQFLINELTI